MANTAEAPRSIEEAYATASLTSDMTVFGGMVPKDHKTGQSVIILAAGLTKARLGMALIAIRAEWDRCEKPPKRSEAQIEARSKELKDKRGKPDIRRARVEAMVWHARMLRERAMKLRGRSAVLGLLTDWALLRGVDVDLLSPSLFHWLSPTCPACDGLGKMRLPDAPALGKQCTHCHGTGIWARPLGASVIHEHIADAIGKAKAGMAGKLRG
jgi:hypothetical protein